MNKQKRVQLKLETNIYKMIFSTHHCIITDRSLDTFMSANTDARKLRNTPFDSYWSTLLRNATFDPFRKIFTSSQERQSKRRMNRQKLRYFSDCVGTTSLYRALLFVLN